MVRGTPSASPERARPRRRGRRSSRCVDAGERLLDGRAPWYREWVTRRDPDDPYWAPMKLDRRAGPRRGAGAPPDRLAGPLPPADARAVPARSSARGRRRRAHRRPVDAHLDDDQGRPPHRHRRRSTGSPSTSAAAGIRTRAAPVRVFVTGADQWRDLAALAAAHHASDVLHLRAGRRPRRRTGAERQHRVVHLRPRRPDALDRRPAARRQSRRLQGRPRPGRAVRRGRLHRRAAHRAARRARRSRRSSWRTARDNPHADLFVAALRGASPTAAPATSARGSCRLDPNDADGVIRLELDAIAHRFSAGNRIRLVIAGGSHPRWERNLGTDDDPATSSRMAPSTRTIDLASSHLVLPTVDPARG